ncbi:MAG: tRNA lysidine(34) synthetase TilS [Caldimonas sp.]
MARRAVAVAYSGGRDSTALLHATIAAAEPLGLRVLALHVHHGLSAEADRWLTHGKALCARWARRGKPVEFVAHVLTARPIRGESVEAWARQARYRALKQMAVSRGVDLVLLAHHRRDQAETFLLQALRGGGAAALSAMPRQVRRDDVTWARPWLDVPRETIDAYVRRHRLGHVDDDSNDDPRFARNRLRAQVWPALIDAFADAEASIADAARWAQEASAALAEMAAIDLPVVSAGEALDVTAWRTLSPARQSNVLRAWLREKSGKAPAAKLVERLMKELRGQGAMRWPMPSAELLSYRGRLRYEAEVASGSPSHRPSRTSRRGSCTAMDLSSAGVHELAQWGGAFTVERVEAGGIALTMATRLELRARAPGDRFQAGPGRPPRSLKLQYQAAGVPTWQRSGPTACHDGALVYVPGLGIDARALAAPGEAQVSLVWRSS